ncbi:MAG: hypothetical protein J1F66_03735 [Clostridiales bacterium]|nr:hypothetical protein [Clostridiales bacterium]
MKRFAIILLSIALLVASFALVACTVDQDTCNHNWGEWEETTPATCTEDGEQSRTCTICKKQETQPIEALGEHQILTEDGSRETCANVDFTVGAECSICGELLTGDALLSVVEHKSLMTVKGTEPTCTETGLSSGRKCLNCGTVIEEQEVIPALDHVEVAAPATEASCTEAAYSAGTVCSRCGEYLSGHAETEPAWGHDFDHGNYYTYVLCANNCGTYGKLTGSDPFETEFIYDFDDKKQEEIDILYETLQAILDGKNSQYDYDGFVELFEEYDDAVGYIQAQYQFARILNDIEYSAESRAELSSLTSYYYTTIARYYGLFKLVNESRFGDQFWEDTGWDAEYIEYVLSLADSYDEDNRNAVDDILDAYEDLLASIGTRITKKQRLQLFDLYSQLVVANNSIAVTAGYDNYMEYAYERIYERDYSPADVAAMRELVKEYIGPIVADVAEAYDAWYANYQAHGWTSKVGENYYYQYAINAVWGNPNRYLDDDDTLQIILNSRQSVADYFTFLSEGDNTVDFYGALQNLFKEGTAFLGNNTNITAYTWYIYQTGTPILVFGGDSSYLDAFTFIHEFGHYYQFVHNDLLSVPMDHDETQSQGNEMLFLAWLYANMPEGADEGFEILELGQLINMLGSIILSTAVDEFEYLVYTGATEFNGKAIATVELSDGREVIDYATLYELILESYWAEIGDWFNTSYWMYVTFNNAAYYISYAMSALPCLELYAKAGNDGLDAARASYLKLFTFSSNDAFMNEDIYIDEEGNEYVDRYLKDDVTYEQILNWAGLSGPFQQELYQAIVEFFANR